MPDTSLEKPFKQFCSEFRSRIESLGKRSLLDECDNLLLTTERMIDSIDDMFIFFNSHLQQLRQSVIKICVPRPGDEEDIKFEAQVMGSQLDKFLRRCLISIGQMMFEHITDLYTQYRLYLAGEPYSYLHSTSQLENWVTHKAKTHEDTSMNHTSEQTHAQMEAETGGVIGSGEQDPKFNH